MQSAQESKQELEAAIRYAENAISSAKQTNESMVFRQEMAKKQSSEKTGREEALENLLEDHRASAFEDAKTISQLKSQVALLEERIADMSSDMVGDANTINNLKAQVNALEQPEKPTMPVIPKAVAIAIFREGLAHGAEAVATEIDNACDICIEESDYVGNFEVSFTKDIDLSDHLDTDWLRGRADEIGETFVLDCLANLCADNKFECRIHGVDDQEEKKND